VLPAGLLTVLLLTTSQAVAWHVKCASPSAPACVRCLTAAHPGMAEAAIRARCEGLAAQKKRKKKK
jgi:hypothetical protein